MHTSLQGQQKMKIDMLKKEYLATQLDKNSGMENEFELE